VPVPRPPQPEFTPAAVVAGRLPSRKRKAALTFEPFLQAGVHPYDEIEWEKRTAEITDDSGKAIFKQENVERAEGLEHSRHQDRPSRNISTATSANGTRTRTSTARTSVRQLVHRSPAPSRLGHRGRLLQVEAGRRGLLQRTDLALRQPARRLQLAGLFNVGLYHQYGVGKESGKGNYFLQPHDPQDRAAPTHTNIRRAAPASSRPSTTTWSRSWTSARSEAMLFSSARGTGSDLSTIAPPAKR